MIAILFAFLLTVVHFFSKKISKTVEKHHLHITSFSAGMFITLIFVDFFPKMTEGQLFGAPVFLALALGFVTFYLTEKYLYQHVTDKKTLLKDLAKLHNFGFFLNHLVIGFVLYLTLELNGTYTNFLVIIPFLLHTLSSSISLEHLHNKLKTKFNKLVLNTSTLLGAILAAAIQLEQFWYFTFFSFFLGSLLYVSMRDMIPKGKKGNPFAFFIGFLITILILSLI
ncbi:MAG: hypothetical protein KKA79_02145 [Nanoarchaeota archaeon]|nr:hypothetical protein [Nanoarchaeota archaeon]MCG2718208.1 hypothetical protein [Nanoarchaeota archaeon]